MPSSRPDHADARTRVLEAALAAAADAAPGPVRVADIAARAQMSPGHVMYYFRSRDRIVTETLLYAESQLATKRDKHLARSASATHAVEQLVRLYLPQGRADPRWRLWAQLLASSPDDAETRSAIGGVIDAWSDTLAAVIRKGCAEGSMSCEDPGRTAYQACRLMDGYGLELLLGGPGRSRTWAVRSVLAALRQTLAFSVVDPRSRLSESNRRPSHYE